MPNPPSNLFRPLPDASSAECFDDIFRRPGCRVERIVSRGQASPPGFWYEQGWDEWVLVLSGGAVLTLASRVQPLTLAAGDNVMIPAGERHRVEWTDPDQPTVWLAVHLGEDHRAD